MELHTVGPQSRVRMQFCNTTHAPISRQYYSAKDLMSMSNPRQLIQLQNGDNQNSCGCGAANESCYGMLNTISEVPPQLQKPTGGIDKRTEMRKRNEEAETRKIRLTSGHMCKTLLDDTKAEPLPSMIRRPGESMRRTRRPPKARAEAVILPIRNERFHEELEKYLNHLPFFGMCRYERTRILKRVSHQKQLRGMLQHGRYYIEKDWKNNIDPRTDPNALLMQQQWDDRKRRKFRSDGPINRIVELFMEKVLSWSVSREMLGTNMASRPSSMALLWLGPSLANRMLNELCVNKNPTKLFKVVKERPVEQDFYIINRLALDIFFSDKETFYCMLNDYILSPSLSCKSRISETSYSGDCSKQTCQELEAKGMLTRRICTHQNLSLSLKPCMVPTCPNFKRPVCEHLYAFIPETILINSYVSMLFFVERFRNVEDLKGCVFITKPAYLCNGRGINFLLEKSQFESFYHMLDGRATSRHGVVLQRYIECPRLFDHQKFTIRFFLLIIVLPKRRVVAFIHYGLAIFCTLPYQQVYRQDFTPEEEALEGKLPNSEVPIACRTIGHIVNPSFNRQVHLSNYYEPEFRAKVKEDLRTGKAVMMEQDEDNVVYLEDVLPSKCLNSTSIYIQMLFAAQCIMDYMQPVIHDYPGTFQTVSVDSLVDARNKLWILEAGTKIFSGLMTVAPRQRQIMSNIIQETLGVTIECFYKSRMDLPLCWNYKKRCKDYDSFFFAQDFNFFYETDITKQANIASQQKSRCSQPKPLEKRYHEVDIMRDLARERRLENDMRKKEAAYQRMKCIARKKQKLEEES